MAKRATRKDVSYLRPVPSSLDDLPEAEREEISSALVAALLSQAPRPLVDLDAELLMFAGQYLLHYKATDRYGVRSESGEHFKLLSSAALKAAFASSPTDSGWLPPGIVRWGENTQGEYVVFWSEPGVYTITLQGLGEPVEDRVVEVALPGLLLVGQGVDWCVWAIAGEVFDPRAELYSAPLPNVGAGGRICWGDNKAPKATPKGAIEAFVLFMSTPFNDHDVKDKSKQRPLDVREFLFDLVDHGIREYPVGDLRPLYLDYGTAHVDAAIKQLFLREA
jgi:PRTRC genetic system protein B